MIRSARPKDLPKINAIYNHEVAHSLFNVSTEAMSAKDRQIWFEQHSIAYPVLVKEDADEILGFVSLSPWTAHGGYARTVELSIFIAPAARGQGLGKQLIAAILKKGKELRYRVFIARIVEGNEASVSLFRGFGFKQVARMPDAGEKFDQYFTALIMQKNLS